MIQLDDAILPPSLLALSGGGFHNPRSVTGLDAESISELSADIEKNGINTPLLVWFVDERYVVIDGQRRLLAVNKLLERAPDHPIADGIPVRLALEASLDDVKLLAIRSFVHRKDISSYETALAVAGVGGDTAEIAKKLELSPTYINLLLGALSAPDTVISRWRSGEIGFKEAYNERTATPTGRRARRSVPNDAKTPVVVRPSIVQIREMLPTLYAERAALSNGPYESDKYAALDGKIAALEWVALGKPM